MYLSAIRAHNIANGFCNPLDKTLQLHQTVRGINRVHGTTTKQKLANTIEMLGQIWPSFPSALTMITLSGLPWSPLTSSSSDVASSPSHTPLPSLQASNFADVQFRTSPDGSEIVVLRPKTFNTDQFR